MREGLNDFEVNASSLKGVCQALAVVPQRIGWLILSAEDGYRR
jgi:hypothetical protein